MVVVDSQQPHMVGFHVFKTCIYVPAHVRHTIRTKTARTICKLMDYLFAGEILQNATKSNLQIFKTINLWLVIWGLYVFFRINVINV